MAAELPNVQTILPLGAPLTQREDYLMPRSQIRALWASYVLAYFHPLIKSFPEF